MQCPFPRRGCPLSAFRRFAGTVTRPGLPAAPHAPCAFGVNLSGFVRFPGAMIQFCKVSEFAFEERWQGSTASKLRRQLSQRLPAHRVHFQRMRQHRQASGSGSPSCRAFYFWNQKRRKNSESIHRNRANFRNVDLASGFNVWILTFGEMIERRAGFNGGVIVQHTLLMVTNAVDCLQAVDD